MKQVVLDLVENRPLTDQVYRLKLVGDCTAVTRPGQFVNLKLSGLFLRRPISVYDATAHSLTLVYKTVGQGTRQLSQMRSGSLDVLTGLGNGYDTSLSTARPVLIGGGVGVPPLYLLAKELIRQGKKPRVILGFNTASEVFCQKEFEELGIDVQITTVDGSLGTKGFVTAAMEDCERYVFTCGPEGMLKAVFAHCADGQFSFEERMGCGFGACMGCTCRTVTGYKRICKEGPVLKKEEILWNA